MGALGMDETAIAFELPHVRAAATGAAAAPLDRISVRDYTRSVEIGAYSTERGVMQRVRFNVVLEVCHHAAAEDDDVDKVISYDTITDAIETELAHERINLLETLAERVARRSLADPRAVRVFVRVEKLDRIPGALGVEIVRTRPDGAAQLRPAAAEEAEPGPGPLVVYLPGSLIAGPREADWRDALAAIGPHVLCLDPAAPQLPARSPAALRIGLLSVEQNAWSLAARDARFAVAATRSEIDWALKHGRATVWAPTKLLTDAVEPPAVDAADPVGLARWLAAEIGAARLIVGGEAAGAAARGGPVAVVGVDRPEALAAAARGPGR